MDAKALDRLADFRGDYASARERRRALVADERRRKRAQGPRKPRLPPEGLDGEGLRRWQMTENLRIEDARRFADLHRFERDMVRERYEVGFRMQFARKVGRRWRENVFERGLRSESFGTAGKLFVASCRRGGELRSSWDKGTLDVQAKAKVLALDYPYVEMNKAVLQWARIDSDKEWPSVTAFKLDVLDLVGRRLPHAPNLVVGDLLPDGRFQNPQLYFALPPGSGVWNDPEDPRCDQERVRWFKGVSYGIVDACRDLGADPNAPVLTMRGKNPLSPLWHAFSMAPETFCDLKEWSVWVDSRLDREKLVRSIFAERSGLDIEGSNGFFRALQKRAAELLRRWHFDRDPRLLGKEPGAVADALHVAMEPEALEAAAAMKAAGGNKVSDRQVARTVAMVADYAAAWWNPDRLERAVNRGQLMHVVAGMRTVKERQQAAAEFASQVKAERTLERLVEAWDLLAVETAEPTKAALAREAGVSRPTVYARWSDLQAVLAAREGCKVRCKEIRIPSVPVLPEHRNQLQQDRAGPLQPTVQSAPDASPVGLSATPPLRQAGQPRPSGHGKPSPAAPLVLRWPEDGLGGDDDERLIAEQEAFLALADDPRWLEDDPPWRHAA